MRSQSILWTFDVYTKEQRIDQSIHTEQMDEGWPTGKFRAPQKSDHRKAAGGTLTERINRRKGNRAQKQQNRKRESHRRKSCHLDPLLLMMTYSRWKWVRKRRKRKRKWNTCSSSSPGNDGSRGNRGSTGRISEWIVRGRSRMRRSDLRADGNKLSLM